MNTLLEMATSTARYWYGFALISIDRYLIQWIVVLGTGLHRLLLLSIGYLVLYLVVGVDRRMRKDRRYWVLVALGTEAYDSVLGTGYCNILAG